MCIFPLMYTPILFLAALNYTVSFLDLDFGSSIMFSMIGTCFFMVGWSIVTLCFCLRDKFTEGIKVTLEENFDIIMKGGMFMNGILGVVVEIYEGNSSVPSSTFGSTEKTFSAV